MNKMPCTAPSDGMNLSRVTGPVSVTAEKVQFRFKERLMFNIPLIYPKVRNANYMSQ